MHLQIWHLEGEGFHWGRHGLGQEESGFHVPSDSLLAAIIARLAALEGGAAVETWVGELRQDPPPLALTSAFPRAGGLLFFPAPYRIQPASNSNAGSAQAPPPKDLKKVRFVSAGLFRRLLDGQPLVELHPLSVQLQNGQVLLLSEEESQLPESARKSGRLWHIEKRPRVAVDRAASSSQIYHTGRTTYQAGCGLWFGVRWEKTDPSGEARLAALLADLGDAGLGGERSSGFGRARFTPAGVLDLPDSEGSCGVALSRYLPCPDETAALSDPRAAYSLLSIGGWVHSPGAAAERRRTVRLLAEGSVIGPLSRAVPGQIVDVQPVYGSDLQPLGHPVWRSGLCVLAGIRSQEETS